MSRSLEDESKNELREMAKAILCELGGAGSFNAASAPDGGGEGETQYGFFRNGMRMRAFGGHERMDADIFGSGFDTGIENSGAPRRERRDFLRQRLERQTLREKRTAAESGQGDKTEFTESRAGLEGGQKRRLAEDVSDSFCRDARRYDGAFERY